MDNTEINNSEVPEAETAEDEETAQKKNAHKHDSGAADLEKVTDYQEEKEISSASASAVHLLDSEREKQDERKKELAKIVIRQDDVDLIVRELEVTKYIAEKKLREHRGNLKEALKSLITVY